HHSNPFAMVKDITFKDAEPKLGADEEHGDDSQAADTQMAAAGGDPDVEQAPDAQGQVSARQTRVARALPVATPPEKRGFFQRVFGGRRNPPAAIPTPTSTPSRRSRGFCLCGFYSNEASAAPPPQLNNSCMNDKVRKLIE